MHKIILEGEFDNGYGDKCEKKLIHSVLMDGRDHFMLLAHTNVTHGGNDYNKVFEAYEKLK